jgi:hypothetical protein
MEVYLIFLGAFSNPRKATISFVMCLSVCLSVRMEQLGYHWTDFREIYFLSIFRKAVPKIQVPLNSDKNSRYFTWVPIHIHDNTSLISYYNDKCFRRKFYRQPNNILCSIIFFQKSCRLWGNVKKKYGRSRQDTWQYGACALRAINTYSEYVILIAFPLQQWLHELA